MPATETAPKPPTPTIAEPPPAYRGRQGQRLNDEYVKSVADALKTLDDGKVVATGESYPTKAKARKAVELVRRELTRVAGLKRDAIGTRIWPDGDNWLGGVHNRKDSE